MHVEKFVQFTLWLIFDMLTILYNSDVEQFFLFESGSHSKSSDFVLFLNFVSVLKLRGLQTVCVEKIVQFTLRLIYSIFARILLYTVASPWGNGGLDPPLTFRCLLRLAQIH